MKTAWAPSVWIACHVIGQKVSDPPTWMEVTASWWALTDWQFSKVCQFQAWTFPPSVWQRVRLTLADRRLALILSARCKPTWAWLPKRRDSIPLIQPENPKLRWLTPWQTEPLCQTLTLDKTYTHPGSTHVHGFSDSTQASYQMDTRWTPTNSDTNCSLSY